LLFGFLQRKEDCEYRSTCWRIVYMNRPVMTVHDLRNDGETKAHSRFFRGHKRIEDFLAQFFGNARTGVGQAQLYSFSIFLDDGLNLDSQRATGFHGFIGILHQIEEGLLAQALIERNEWKIARVFALHAHRLFAGKTRGNNLQHAIKQRSQVGGIRLRMQRAGEVEKLGHEGAKPVDLGRNVSG